ncbi:uncharacterized protein EI97DRAFT_175370 [Westerdykella ornata]|uniref:Uncharacterized protein n=1 Tax=Westerdykella ornata TaxID=318751 RepID=A0A6A6JT34_WESOR|nr:uncharacterized protein EI97DRAFT_175370 [Westerdykella ornata]KAF2279404.1 hypothetical protein EI97DRAFT_175370 [Westerdykella ornata]
MAASSWTPHMSFTVFLSDRVANNKRPLAFCAGFAVPTRPVAFDIHRPFPYSIHPTPTPDAAGSCGPLRACCAPLIPAIPASTPHSPPKHPVRPRTAAPWISTLSPPQLHGLVLPSPSNIHISGTADQIRIASTEIFLLLCLRPGVLNPCLRPGPTAQDSGTSLLLQYPFPPASILVYNDHCLLQLPERPVP